MRHFRQMGTSRSFLLICTHFLGTVIDVITAVRIKRIEKDLLKLRPHLLEKFRKWVKDVETDGIEAVQKVRAWRDHPLKGRRRGQRSISLNGPWRAIYEIKGEEIEFVDVMEVTPHDY